jgi:chaperonin GroES
MEEINMKLKPMADNVLLKAHEEAATTVSGIVLATAAKEKPAIFEVVSAGPGTKDVAMTVKAGDRVVVAKHVGYDVTIDKVDYKFVKQDEILAVVTD